MAIYKTGRTRTLNYESTIEGFLHFEWSSEIPPPPVPYLPYANSEFNLGVWGASASGGPVFGSFPSPGYTGWPPLEDPFGQDVGYQVIANTGLGNTQTSQVWTDTTVGTPPVWATWERTLTGTVTFELDVEEILEVTGSGWPSYGGTSHGVWQAPQEPWLWSASPRDAAGSGANDGLQ